MARPSPSLIPAGMFSPVALPARICWRRFRAAGLRRRRIALPNASLSFWQGGAPHSPLMLIQGFGASAVWQWHSQVGALAGDRSLIVPDLLGFGGSVLQRGAHSLDAQVDALRGLLDRLSIQAADLAGISYGGFVALRLAQRHPDRVRRLVIVDSPGVGYTPADYDRLLQRFSIRHVSELLMPRRPALIRRLLRIALHRPPWIPEPLLPSIHRSFFSDRLAEKRQMLDDALAMLRQPGGPPDALPPHEAMVVWGEHDPLFPLALGERMAHRLGAALRVVPETAHAPNVERPVWFNHHVNRFLR